MRIARPFSANVHYGPTCWEWMGSLNRKGYGLVRYQGTVQAASRVSWKIHNGEIPKGMQVCHKCDNPGCVRIDHLFLGTNQENQIDSVAKGRHASTKKTHCRNGHAYTPENTYLRKNINERVCKTCSDARCAAYAIRRKSIATNVTL